MNNWSVIGRVGKDAVVAKTNAGTSVANFSVAIDIGWGEKKTTMWAKCKLFGERADKLAPYIKKGDRIGVQGEISLEEWTDRDNNKRTDLAVNVKDVTLCGEKPADGSAKPASERPAAAPAGASAPHQANIDESEIPF